MCPLIWYRLYAGELIAINDYTSLTSNKAVLVGVEVRRSRPLFAVEDSLDELTLLAQTAGVDVCARAQQRVSHIDPATFMGSGKLEELSEIIKQQGANTVIFDDELSPRHQREIEKTLGEGVQVLDRSALILDIFALHASTREGALQVELAQYEYRLPRLTRQWAHLARQAGGGTARGGSGGVGLRGPGETQLEVDRREIGQKITRLRKDIEAVRAHRERHRLQRVRAGIPTVAMVGYTNAGKSTLLNALSGSDVYVANQLFATLDPTTRRVTLPSGRLALFSDTVGFIQKLPVTLIAAFRATLEEITEADLILHVVDASHPRAWDQIDVVEDTIAELEASRIPKLLVLNKIDRGEIPRPLSVEATELGYREIIRTSGTNGTGLEELLASVERALASDLVRISIVLPYAHGEWLAAIYQQGIVVEEEHTEAGVRITAQVSERLAGQLRRVVSDDSETRNGAVDP